jgi:hypothetical protein
MKLKYLIIAIPLFLLSFNSEAQLSKVGIGGGINLVNYFGDFEAVNPGINLRLSYDIIHYGTINIGYVMGLPYSNGLRLSATAAGDAAVPGSVIVDARKSIVFNTFYMNYSFFMVNNNEHFFGFYSFGGMNFTAVKVDYTFSSQYDHSVYHLDRQNSLKASFGINAGLGIQHRIKFITVFLEAYGGVPINKISGVYVEDDIPLSIGGNLGIKFQKPANTHQKGGKRRKSKK